MSLSAGRRGGVRRRTLAAGCFSSRRRPARLLRLVLHLVLLATGHTGPVLLTSARRFLFHCRHRLLLR
jgi:hypothetical protein